MYYFLLILLILNGLFLSVVVLLQSGKGGGLASMGGGAGTDTLIGGRQAATLLTKASWIGGGTFMALSLILAIVSTRQQTPQSVLQREFQTAPVQAPQPVIPGATAPATTDEAPGQPAQPPAQGTAPQTNQ